jgi:putative acetyltransferase
LELIIAPDDPLATDVQRLLEEHLAFAHKETPTGHVHALSVERLLDPAVTFFSARAQGVLLGVGALKRLDSAHAEIKSMHTARASRRQGVGRKMVEHLLSVAASQHFERVSLETGSMDAFSPARALYRSVGFRPCPPFGDYTENPYSVCMTISLGLTQTDL